MKKTLFISAIALLISGGLAAQSNVQVRNENRSNGQTQQRVQSQEQIRVMDREQIKEQARIQKREAKAEKIQARTQARIHKQEAKAEMKQTGIQTRNENSNHGAAVSETARNTQSGPGKGEVVSTRARNKSTVHQAKPAISGKAATRKAANGAALRTGKGRM